jgi:hypothetical protein
MSGRDGSNMNLDDRQPERHKVITGDLRQRIVNRRYEQNMNVKRKEVEPIVKSVNLIR